MSAQQFKVGLTADEKRLYSQLFKSLDPEGTGVITGEKARSTFEKSGLPPAILGEIWQLADKNNLGFLTQFGFCYAMRLIGYTQAGQPPSETLADTPGPLPKFAQFGLQPQSTNSSLMQTQPTASVPFQAQPQDPVPPVSSADYKKFSDLFIRTTGSPSIALSGTSARDIFLKAKLPTDTLGQIWNLVDTENMGKLTMPSFVVAMHLIQGLLSGTITQLPPFLSDTIWQSATVTQPTVPASLLAASGSRQSSYASVSSQQTVKHTPDAEWLVTPTMKQQYDTLFDNLDKSKTGKLNPDQVAQFLMTSKLGQQDLASVWDLSDIQNTGVFSKLEFAIALFLVNKKLAGGSLPNVIPESLIQSIQAALEKAGAAPVQSPVQAPPPAQIAPAQTAPKLAAQKTAMDDLVDVFSSPAPAQSPATAPAPTPTQQLQARASSSDLSNDLPKVRKNLTGFKPTSNFGQTLMKEHEHDLLGDDVKGTSPVSSVRSPLPSGSPAVASTAVTSPAVTSPAVASPAAAPAQTTGSYFAPGTTGTFVQSPGSFSSPAPSPAATNQAAPVQTPEYEKKVNYDALRSVPPPPKKETNSDLLADPKISGQLSQATSDIANISNQVKSLSSQTSELHEKKTRADQELNKILSVKKDIESKLRILKSSYDNEVKQYQEVEQNLAKAKEESEALRSESSIAEAKLNHLSSDLNEKQVAMENLQKENGSVKEKLGNINAELGELEKQSQSLVTENQRLNNQLSVKKSQVQVVLVKKQELEAHISELTAKNQQLQYEINLQAEQEANAIEEQEALAKKAEEAKKFVPVQPEPVKKTADSSKLATAGIAGAVGAAVAAGAATAGSILGRGEESTATEPTTEKPVAEKSVKSNEESVAALVDDVQTQPSADMTGIEMPKSESISAMDKMDREDATTTSSIGGENETPITSPTNSEFQFPQGGMVGMPGVLVGVQRADSLTSSVQNNAAMSVRDDNVEVSDRDTINAEPEDKLSGGESFEMVNADDAKEKNDGVDGVDRVDDEFPPIKELDYDESSSDEDEYEEAKGSSEPVMPGAFIEEPVSTKSEKPTTATEATKSASEEFTSQFGGIKPAAPETDMFADLEPAVAEQDADAFADLEPAVAESDAFAFEDLEPAVAEQADADGFEDEFADLTVAKEDADTSDFFNNDFTNSNMPDFSSPVETQKTGNDEWEQLFAGFGNAPGTPVAAAPVTTTAVAAGGDHEAVQELVGMGFDEKTAEEALSKMGGDLEAATNYLLDNA